MNFGWVDEAACPTNCHYINVRLSTLINEETFVFRLVDGIDKNIGLELEQSGYRGLGGKGMLDIDPGRRRDIEASLA